MISKIRQYLHMHVDMVAGTRGENHSPSIWRFFLENGVECGPKVACTVPVGPARECFTNTFSALAYADDDWVYCEGYAMKRSLGLPMHHAWLYNTATGEVMDPTASWTNDEAVYFGVPFNSDYVSDHAMETHWPSPAFDGEMFRPELFEEGPEVWGAHPALRPERFEA